jgi:protein-disulfide isomerase
LAGALALAAAGASGGARAGGFVPEPDDMAIGDPRARVTVVEYASVGCPHCAKWNNEVFPAFKAQFIDRGIVRFVVRECLTGSRDLAVAGFMLARCAGPSKYFQVIEAIYRRQMEIFQTSGILHQIGTDAGLTPTAFDACLSDQSGLDAFQARAQRHADVDKVDSTPTFEINGTRIEGEASLKDLAAAIAAARRGR